MKNLFTLQKKAFTLIEILVVVTIIGMLLAGAIASYSVLTRQARDSRRKSDLEQLRSALELYKATNNKYPQTTSTPNTVSWKGLCSAYGSTSDYVPGLVGGGYMQSLPVDPRNGIANTAIYSGCTAAQACYLYSSDGVAYKILADCTPEMPISMSDDYYDPIRQTWAFQISSNEYAKNNW